jgi:hypothetical protein
MPGPPGSGSSNVAARAVPDPVLVTPMVKPMLSVVETDGSSAVLVISKAGPNTTVVSVALTGPSFVAEAVAVFSYVPALAAVVPLRT